MSVTISLTPKTEGYSNQSLAVSAGSEADNYAKLDKQLGLTSKHQSVVIDGEGSAVKLLPEGVNGSGFTFVVRERSDAELDGTGDKWAAGEMDEHQQGLDARFAAPRTKNAAMNAYTGKANAAPSTYFLDYNETLRASYLAGLSAQVPADYIATSTDENRVGGVPHEPTVGSVANDRTATLRWAYFLGLQNGDKQGASYLPCPLKLRAAYKRGKEAVCITIGESDWGSIDIDTFKKCAVPAEYAVYEGGADKDEAGNADLRGALREIFYKGIDDAWAARKAGSVTAITAADRVSDAPSIQQAFNQGVKAAKSLQAAAPGTHFATDASFKVTVAGESDPKYVSERTAFERGLAAGWSQLQGDALAKPDSLYPDTSAEETAAFEAGMAAKRAEAKDREEERRQQEQYEEENPPEKTMMEKFTENVITPFKKCLSGCATDCCATDKNDGNLLFCGTSMGDIVIILTLFALYYMYLAMWMWAFIEILQVVAEPQRPH